MYPLQTQISLVPVIWQERRPQPALRRAIGTFFLLAQKLVFHNSDLSKSITVCKVGDLEVSPKPFWIWKHIHVHKVYAHEVHAYELHAHKVHTHGARL